MYNLTYYYDEHPSIWTGELTLHSKLLSGGIQAVKYFIEHAILLDMGLMHPIIPKSRRLSLHNTLLAYTSLNFFVGHNPSQIRTLHR